MDAILFKLLAENKNMAEVKVSRKIPVADYVIPGVGLAVALLAVLTENAEFNDFPFPIVVGLSFVIGSIIFGYHVYEQNWKSSLGLLFAIFFQVLAIRSADYSSFVQAHLLTILFVIWSLLNKVRNRILLIGYGLSLLFSLVIIYGVISQQ